MRGPRSSHPRVRRLLGTLALVVLSAGAGADDEGAAAAGLDPALGARAIYERVLENRFDASAQELLLVSGDRAGRELPIRVVMLWRRYGEDTPEGQEGVLSRTLVRYEEPADVRGTGYLVINKKDAPNDQFVYLPSMRRTRRINLRSESVVGTDLSVEDIVPRELDDATYTRVADEVVDGTPCYVVEAVPKPEVDSAYSKFRMYVEGAHYVPLKTRYWDATGVEVKELTANAASIRKIEDIWLPVRATMRQLLQETYTRLSIDRLTPNPDLGKKFFTERQLEQSRLRLPRSIKRASLRIE